MLKTTKKKKFNVFFELAHNKAYNTINMTLTHNFSIQKQPSKIGKQQKQVVKHIFELVPIEI